MTFELYVDRTSEEPLYRQIAGAVRSAVSAGRLAAGVKLPSTRTVSKQLGIHRRTVVQAFRLLEEEGWVVSGVGQGTFVSERAAVPEAADERPAVRDGARPGAPAPPAPPSDPPVPPGPFAWDAVLRRRGDMPGDLWRSWTQRPASGEAIRFTGATADPSLFPAEDFRAIMDEVFTTQGPKALDYGPTEGYLPLREWVAERLCARGVAVSPDEVMIVTGSQQGLDLLSRLVAREGEAIAVEEPGYTNGFRLFQSNGVRTPGIPMDEGGIRLDAFEEACVRHAPRALYLMPHFQNPTGLSLAPERVEPLLAICARHRVPVIEDQFDVDLHYEGPVPVPVRAHDRSGLVLLLGSFSKILFPGLRLGWLVAPRALLGPLHDLKQMADFSSGLLVQCAMDLFCRRGLLDRHLERVRGIYGARLRVLLEAMDREMPGEVRWTRPGGGLTLWVRLPGGFDAMALLQQARAAGVDFSPGAWFYPNGGGGDCLRICYVRETEERIRSGIRILGGLIREEMAHGRTGAAAGPFF